MSRTIADLESEEKIEMRHVAEAINYRVFDTNLFGQTFLELTCGILPY